MKTRNLANYLIALLVLVCSAVLLAALTFTITGYRLREPSRLLYVDLRDAAGVDVGSLVYYAGQPAGEVVAIRHLTPEERRQSDDPSFVLRMTLALNDDLPPLASDIQVGVGMESFLGKKFIALTPGSLDAKPLENGAILRADQAGLMEVVQHLSENVDGLIENINRDYSKLIPKIDEFIGKAEGIANEGSNLVVNLNSAVTNIYELTARIRQDYSSDYSRKVSSILSKVENLGTNVNASISRIDTQANHTLREASLLIETNRANLDKMIAELRVVSQNLKVVSTYAKALTGQLGEKPSRVIFSKKREDLLPSEQEILDSDDPIIIELDRKKN